jgi:hypothetical protein
MDLEQFSQLVKHKDQEKEMYKYFDEHLVLHSLLSTNFSDINIDLKEDEDGCFYLLRPSKNCDISYMESLYNNIRVDFFAHKFVVGVTICNDNNIIIRLIDKKGMA